MSGKKPLPDKPELVPAQIQADLFIAKATIKEAKRQTPRLSKTMKGQAGYHLQQATEKLIKIQLYRSNKSLDFSKIFNHRIGDLILYGRSLGIDLIVPPYIENYAEIISGWEAEGRYDPHFVVRIDTLEKCAAIVSEWFDSVTKPMRHPHSR
ncbi:MAG: hypothetical protein IK016_08695 [Lachnospiraceae bacterium]|nr:hypothetical protein [Lachnospiraceae bacterium]